MFSSATFDSFWITEANNAANKKALKDLKKFAVNTMASIAIGTSVITNPVPADAIDMQPSIFSTTNVVAKTETRQGLYQEYEVEVDSQNFDDARSTFKSAKETKSKKGQ